MYTGPLIKLLSAFSKVVSFVIRPDKVTVFPVELLPPPLIITISFSPSISILRHPVTAIVIKADKYNTYFFIFV